MGELEKIDSANRLALAIRTYGAVMISNAETVHGGGAEPSVRVSMKDGLTFHLPWDFSAHHIDTVFAIASAARIKGRDEATLEGVSGAQH